MGSTIARLDWLLRGPGLIRSAAVNSAFLIDDTLYFLRTGPGWQRLGGSYQAFDFVANPVIERQMNRNRQALAAMGGWDFAAMVPQRAEMRYPLASLARVQVTVPQGPGIAFVKLKASEGKPRSLSLEAQDYLAGEQARERFFAALPAAGSR